MPAVSRAVPCGNTDGHKAVTLSKSVCERALLTLNK
jgi:hypothetical protein